CWSPFANEAGNYNVAVTGKSGSGKSVLMQELVAGMVAAGGEAVVIDDGRSFQHAAEALDGAFIAFGKDAATLNPFAMIDAETAEHDGDYREECLSMLAGVIGRMARRRGSMDDIEAALVAEAISAAWDEAGNGADLGTVRRNLEARDDRRARDMGTALGPWCPGGAMGRLFSGSGVPDLDNALTVFELAELKGRGDVQAVVLMLVVFLATQRMYHGPRTRAKAIVIDEAWDLLSGEDSRAFLEGAARRARKYRGALVTGTQSVNDYYANPAARAAWENSDWVIFLAQKDESVELLKSEGRIHCDAGMERALKSLSTADGRYAELVLHGPDGWRVARLVLDAWSVALFSSRGPAFAAVESLKAEGLTTVEAIDRIIGADGASASSRSETSNRKGDPA
ncbi:MAG: type-IV secretion system protein TraC, partial [Chloroflexi bacterium]|nr:type-IV secretion system protein TraC [Chloroflexota bacterium]